MGVIHSFSFGGGVQSTAALVLAAQGKLPATDESFRWDVFLFANVGERAESPATIKYVEEYAKPFAAEHGIDLREVRKRLKDGTEDDLLTRIERGQRSIPIPVRLSSGAPGRRSCTADFKIKPIERALKSMGATADNPAIVGIGISMDEIQRVKGWGEADPRSPNQIREYPLIRLNLRRRDCIKIVTDSGLPQHPRSACWFCPFHSLDEWRRLKREEPDLFEKACEIEEMLGTRRGDSPRDRVWMTDHLRPLSEVVQDQLVLSFDDEHGGDGATCDTGHCFT